MTKVSLLFIGAALLLTSCANDKADHSESADSSSATSDVKAASELLDPAMGDVIKNSFMSFGKGDVDGMTAPYDDNIRYYWSSGDSIIGKKAVQDYWKSRWSIIDSLSFDEQITLPIQVNEPQVQSVQKGKWVLYWSRANVKYKNGKKLTFWLHNVNHFNDAGKIDFTSHYYDRAPIMEATKGLTVK